MQYLESELLEQTSDDFLQNLLKSFRAPTITPDLSLAAQFQFAHQKSDWRALQQIGSTILFDDDVKNEELPSDYILAILRFSLNFRANPELQEKLNSSHSEQTSNEVPQTWLQFATRIREKQWQSASAFLSLEDRPTLENTDLATALSFLETFEELFTDPEMETEPVGKQILQSALPAIIREFLTAPDFPNKKISWCLSTIIGTLVNLQKWFVKFGGCESSFNISRACSTKCRKFRKICCRYFAAMVGSKKGSCLAAFSTQFFGSLV